MAGSPVATDAFATAAARRRRRARSRRARGAGRPRCCPSAPRCTRPTTPTLRMRGCGQDSRRRHRRGVETAVHLVVHRQVLDLHPDRPEAVRASVGRLDRHPDELETGLRPFVERLRDDEVGRIELGRAQHHLPVVHPESLADGMRVVTRTGPRRLGCRRRRRCGRGRGGRGVGRLGRRGCRRRRRAATREGEHRRERQSHRGASYRASEARPAGRRPGSLFRMWSRAPRGGTPARRPSRSRARCRVGP